MLNIFDRTALPPLTAACGLCLLGMILLKTIDSLLIGAVIMAAIMGAYYLLQFRLKLPDFGMVMHCCVLIGMILKLCSYITI